MQMIYRSDNFISQFQFEHFISKTDGHTKNILKNFRLIEVKLLRKLTNFSKNRITNNDDDKFYQ
ncbi:hypothetical protein BpHYR1_051533 [Brachionus plicatilis]|uniref:Uncharacterized protein n=1 Tax=Brachionus plicatilis TaxID=10195 RepID=A0A3M7R989_BRAPC|nr:hypothetical protein BpHYR1_051533 [Brachionus plicatilis]